MHNDALFHLGCPVWAVEAWRGNFYTTRARREEFLPQYASVFNAAEGNATFYATPPVATVERWAEEAPETFRFCLKLPREITHDRLLAEATEPLHRFLDRVAPLGERLGPFLVQLPAAFGPKRLRSLRTFLEGLPSNRAYAVEVRHPLFFDDGRHEDSLEALLAECGVDRAIFDTRGLFASSADDEGTLKAKGQKPRVPVRFSAVGNTPLVRFVGDPELPNNAPLLGQWARQFAAWIAEGKKPYFFAHHPDDRLAPALAEAFHRQLRAELPEVPPLPAWPADVEARADAQLSLF